MARLSEFDHVELANLLRRQEQVVSRAQALRCGMSEEAVRHRIRPGGPWQRLLPGVYLAATGTSAADQRDMAALLYAGPRSVITGAAALRHQGIRAPGRDVIDLLVPAGKQRLSRGFVKVHHTTRMPEYVIAIGRRRYALAARAVADAARGMSDLDDVRAVMAGAIQSGRCPLGLLAQEVREGPPRGSALPRAVLAEVHDCVRSAPEGGLHSLIKAAGLPMPMFNARLYVGATLLAIPDAWWPRAGVAAEADSREWHLSPEHWRRTLERHSRMSAYGIIVLHFTPADIYGDPAKVAAIIGKTLQAGAARPPLAITARPAAA